MPNSVQPFPFPDRYFQDPAHLHAAKSMKDYVAIFEHNRDKRPGGKFAPADITELMRLAEDLGAVHKLEIGFIRRLINRHPDYFPSQAQIDRLTKFADRHEEINKARKNDFMDGLIGMAPIAYFRDKNGTAFLRSIDTLAQALRASEKFYRQHDTFDPTLIREVNRLAEKLCDFIDDLSLSDVDKPGRAGRKAHLRNLANLLSRPFGKTSHEAKWTGKKWLNWNRDITVYPKRYKEAKKLTQLAAHVKRNHPLRIVAGGHNFNIASSMGGKKDKLIGTLVTLDEYKVERKKQWKPVTDAAKYNVSADQATRVVRASAGMRLRDFAAAVAEAGMALPVAGSTDAQSLGGLIATDLHSTGRTSGFLSEQVLETMVIDAKGDLHSFAKDESIARGHNGRWTWTKPDGSSRALTKLPVAGALGLLGVVAEVVLKLDRTFNLETDQTLVPREWAETNITEFLESRQPNEIFDYDHVSFYYAGGGGPELETVRLNSWKRTIRAVSGAADPVNSAREILDHIGSSFLPGSLLRLAHMKSTIPGESTAGADPIVKALNNRKPLVLAAKDAFARKLYFQHDEIESGLHILLKNGKRDYQIFRDAMVDVQNLLLEEEMRTVIEVRFTPDNSEAMLGPGTGGPTCYIELAPPMGEYSRARIVQVFHAFDTLLRGDTYKGRPHLGKKTSVSFDDMKKTYGADWDTFLEIRNEIDPGDKFLPKENELLNRIFKP